MAVRRCSGGETGDVVALRHLVPVVELFERMSVIHPSVGLASTEKLMALMPPSNCIALTIASQVLL